MISELIEIDSAKADSPSANADIEAKQALWQAIQILAGELRSRRPLEIYLDKNRGRPLTSFISRPDERFWKLVEILSVFVLLRDANEVHSSRIDNLLGQILEPIAFMEDGKLCYLWTQRTMSLSRSGFKGIPDIAVTNTPSPPSRENTIDIIEVKSGSINSRLIRQEFAKAFDLRINSYSILSYQRPTQDQIEGARQLGLDLDPLEFDSPSERSRRLEPKGLIDFISETLSKRRRFARFERMLAQSADESVSKRLRS